MVVNGTTPHASRRGGAEAPPRADLKVGPYEACLPSSTRGRGAAVAGREACA